MNLNEFSLFTEFKFSPLKELFFVECCPQKGEHHSLEVNFITLILSLLQFYRNMCMRFCWDVETQGTKDRILKK